MSVLHLDGTADAVTSEVIAELRALDRPTTVVQEWPDHYVRRLFVTDVIGVATAAAVVHAVTLVSWAEWGIKHPLSPLSLGLTLGLALAWLVALGVSDSREGRVIGWGPDEYKRVVRGTLPLFAMLTVASYLFRLDIPRTYVVVMLPVGLLAILAGRFGWRRWLHRQRAAGNYMTRVIAVGDARTVNDLVRDLSRAQMSGYQVVGACVPDAETADGVLVPVVGGVGQVAEAARQAGVDAVAVTASGAFGAEEVRRLSWELEDTGTDLVLAPALTNIAGPRVHTQPVGGLPLIHVAGPTYRGANKQLKRIFDIVGASLLLVLLSPLMAAVAVAVKLDKGPVFFRQERVGLHGRSFRMVKFRSMVVNAEKLLAQVAHDRDAGNDVMFKAKNDPRITRVGRFIRRFSLDELPQLFNVITGEMSLVGPRPPLMAEVELYGTDARRRMLVKPGITGLWQVSGRSDLTWDDTVRLDAYYVENWSITGDLVILWKTAKAVVSPSGAY
jgi:exopolysaccharide biosynthesis polyprenyl glycosylphosphotransferase